MQPNEGGRPLRVLVVEDNPDVREMLVGWCRRLGCKVRQADNGVRAMRVWWAHVDKGEPFDFVILDFATPKMDGLTFAERVRTAEAQLGMEPAYIYGLTGYAEELNGRGTLKMARLDEWEEKPGDPARLTESLAREAEGRGCRTRSRT